MVSMVCTWQTETDLRMQLLVKSQMLNFIAIWVVDLEIYM